MIRRSTGPGGRETSSCRQWRQARGEAAQGVRELAFTPKATLLYLFKELLEDLFGK
ncbi:hypothetical protein KH5H1_55960 [Corallococcus caeni]|uniref:hypothetical protein n=1 Tax=Corallococcus caeni TaxID=3082388 RepID=UPI00295613EE|nr:hypothetical protein KH5H1_55960 [Corallococcus sp. KH5-1]